MSQWNSRNLWTQGGIRCEHNNHNFLMTFERETERDISLLFAPFMRSLVDSCMCPDWELGLQPWRTGVMLWPNELPSQGTSVIIKVLLNKCQVEFHTTYFGIRARRDLFWLRILRKASWQRSYWILLPVVLGRWVVEDGNRRRRVSPAEGVTCARAQRMTEGLWSVLWSVWAAITNCRRPGGL